MKKEIIYDQVYEEVMKLGINSGSGKYRTMVLMTNIIWHKFNHPDKTTDEIIAVEESKMEDMSVSLRKAKEQLEDKLHRSDLPEELFNGDVIEKVIDYVIKKIS